MNINFGHPLPLLNSDQLKIVIGIKRGSHFNFMTDSWNGEQARAYGLLAYSLLILGPCHHGCESICQREWRKSVNTWDGPAGGLGVGDFRGTDGQA